MDDVLRFDLMLRWARRHRDLSQRELARWSAVPKSTIADFETGRSQPTLPVAQELLGTMGFALALVDPHTGRPCPVQRTDNRRDRGGRRVPPHLDVRARSRDELWDLRYGSGRPGCDPSPLTWRTHRDSRDELRAHGYLGDHPFRHPPAPDRQVSCPVPSIGPFQMYGWRYAYELRSGLVEGFDERLRWRGTVAAGAS